MNWVHWETLLTCFACIAMSKPLISIQPMRFWLKLFTTVWNCLKKLLPDRSNLLIFANNVRPTVHPTTLSQNPVGNLWFTNDKMCFICRFDSICYGLFIPAEIVLMRCKNLMLVCNFSNTRENIAMCCCCCWHEGKKPWEASWKKTGNNFWLI